MTWYRFIVTGFLLITLSFSVSNCGDGEEEPVISSDSSTLKTGSFIDNVQADYYQSSSLSPSEINQLFNGIKGHFSDAQLSDSFDYTIHLTQISSFLVAEVNRLGLANSLKMSELLFLVESLVKQAHRALGNKSSYVDNILSYSLNGIYPQLDALGLNRSDRIQFSLDVGKKAVDVTSGLGGLSDSEKATSFLQAGREMVEDLQSLNLTPTEISTLSTDASNDVEPALNNPEWAAHSSTSVQNSVFTFQEPYPVVMSNRFLTASEDYSHLENQIGCGPNFFENTIKFIVYIALFYPDRYNHYIDSWIRCHLIHTVLVTFSPCYGYPFWVVN